MSFASARPGNRLELGGRPIAQFAGRIRRREREVRDTLWLLLTMALVLAPHAAELPPWCTAAIVALIVWRAWLTWTGRRLPNRWIPVAFTCIAGIAVWAEYRTIFGKDAGVAYVTLLLGLKLMEMRARRDIFVVIFLCLFVMLTALFESQSIGMGALLVVGTWMLVTALVSEQFADHEPRWRTKALISLRLVVFAMPLMAVLFVLFPRIEGPLWGMPSDAYANRTGLSDVMAPGSFGRLSESREIAFRVRFDGRVPEPNERYWRGPVLGSFDGRAWTPLPPRRVPASRSVEVDPESAIDYTTTLEPSHRTWLFALDMLGSSPSVVEGRRTLIPRLRSDLQVVADAPIHERAQFVARSFTRYRAGADETRARLQEWLELPPGFDPRTHALAAQMADEANRDDRAAGREASDADRTRRFVDRTLQMIRTQGFVYTLDPPALGRDSVDEFLFDSRRGYCEHFASAFVFLMRALDVPARVVTGYQGGDMNPVDGYLEIRQRDAHAWAEVWVAQRGWMRVDPTAAVAPDRIDRGVAEGLAGQGGFASGVGWLSTLVQRTRFNIDAVSNAWDQWVLAYNGDRQSGLFKGFGIERVDWQTLTIALVIAFSAVLAGIAGLTLFKRAKADPVQRQFAKACALLAQAAAQGAPRRDARADIDRDVWRRRASEGPRAYLARIRERLSPTLAKRAETAFGWYEALRYARRPTDFDEATTRARFAASVAALREHGA